MHDVTEAPVLEGACRQLWCGVLELAIDEALASAPGSAERRWIGSRGFREVCWLAGFDPEVVESRLRARLAAPPVRRRRQCGVHRGLRGEGRGGVAHG